MKISFCVFRYVTILLFAGIILSCNSETDQVQKPNIVVILSDDQGWGDFGINGNTNLNTPNIDNLAIEGAQFENFYVQPVCSPTRAEFLTGRYHWRGGVHSTSAGGERLDLDETTIAEIFKDAGYATATFGKWHNGMQYPYHPNGRGFDEFYGFASGHWGSYFSPMLEHNGKIVNGSGYLPNDITDHTISFIQKHKESPFLLYVAFNVPHAPMQVPELWYTKFEKKELGLLADSTYSEDPNFTRAALAMCENLDWNVGRIIKILDELALDKNTIVVYFNDNGPNEYRWNGGMKGKKGSTDEGGVRSPLFFKWPGKIKQGKKIQQLAGAIDLFPTLADLANIPYETKKKMDGISLKDVLLKDTVPELNRTIINAWRSKISVRNQHFRLGNDNALYDITHDRGQNTDVSHSYPEMKRMLLNLKQTFKDEMNHELGTKDSRPFLIGHPDTEFTQIPARDGMAHGNIQRSNKFPNCSFFTNWKTVDDFISWDTEVVEKGVFEVTLYGTVPEEALNSKYELSIGESKLKFTIDEMYDPPLEGMENDRVKRNNSYIKAFKPIVIGDIFLDKGKAPLLLTSLSLPNKKGIDVRLLLFRRKRP